MGKELELRGGASRAVSCDEEEKPTYGKPASPVQGVRVGRCVGAGPEATPLVDYPGNPLGPLPARVLADARGPVAGEEVLLTFEGEDGARPIVLGVLRAPPAPEAAPEPGPPLEVSHALEAASAPEGARAAEVHVDGQRVEIAGADEVVLRCGKASITLRRNGRVVLRGVTIESAADGLHRIKGGAVRIN